MLISGFSFAPNTEKLCYPTVESIRSILPVCEEFVVAVGAGDADDTTREKIAAIGDPKIRIIDTEWTDLENLRSRIYSQQTNIALDNCNGQWCFYLQSDEVVHEKYLPEIRNACERFSDDTRVDGFLFGYKHFWGDYDHYVISHKKYPREIRIIRNNRTIGSVGDAQSFKYENGKKIPVVAIDATVFHYGYVRDPRKVNARQKTVGRIYKGMAGIAEYSEATFFDYGSLEKLPVYTDSYPRVMRERIASMDWKHLLQYRGPSRVVHSHNRLRNRILIFIEYKLLRGSGREFWGYKPFRFLRSLSRHYRNECQHHAAHRYDSIQAARQN